MTVKVLNKDERVLKIKSLCEQGSDEEFNFDKKNYPSKQINIEDKYLIYRLNNTRTLCAQREYVAEKGLEKGFFNNSRIENDEVQETQHDLLMKEAYANNHLKEAYNKTGGQTDPLIIYPDGRVVNGNRRLAFMRNEGMSEIKCKVLTDPYLQDKELEIEAYLDYEPEAKKEFDWTSIGLSIIDLIDNQKLTPKQVQKRKSLVTDKEVILRAEATKMAQEALVRRGTPEKWSDVLNSEQIFMDTAAKTIRTSVSPSQKEALKLATILVDSASSDAVGERKYAPVKDLLSEPDFTKKIVFEKFEGKSQKVKDHFGKEEEVDKASLDEKKIQKAFNSQDDIDEVVGDILVQVATRKDDLASKGSKEALKKNVNDGAKKLLAATQTLAQDPNKEGVTSKLVDIKGYLKEIEDYLK